MSERLPSEMIAELSRLGSVDEIAGCARQMLAENGALLGGDDDGITGDLMANLLYALASYERELAAEREGRPCDLLPLSPPPDPAILPPGVEAVVRDALAAGLSPRATADRLNGYGIPSQRGGRWHATSVRRLLARLDHGELEAAMPPTKPEPHQPIAAETAALQSS